MWLGKAGGGYVPSRAEAFGSYAFKMHVFAAANI